MENLKELLQEREEGFLRSWAGTKDKALDAASRLEEVGLRQVLAVGRDMDRNVSNHPWYAIAGTAVLSLLLGCAVSRSCRD